MVSSDVITPLSDDIAWRWTARRAHQALTAAPRRQENGARCRTDYRGPVPGAARGEPSRPAAQDGAAARRQPTRLFARPRRGGNGRGGPGEWQVEPSITRFGGF